MLMYSSIVRGVVGSTVHKISVPVVEPARAHLVAVRRGELPLERVVADLSEKTGQLELAVLRGDLPQESDARAVDALLVRAYERAWAERRPAPGHRRLSAPRRD